MIKNLFLLFFLMFQIHLSFAEYIISLPDKIDRQSIKKNNLKLPFIGLGTVELGRNWGIGGAKSKTPPAKIVKDVLLTAYENGWRVIDTASSYQASEELIGRFLPHDKNSYILITKPGEHSILNSDPLCKRKGKVNQYCEEPAAKYDFSHDAIIKDINESLQKLKVKQIDIALLHLQNETALAVLKNGEALQTLRELQKEGKVKYIGVSVNGPAANYAVQNGDIDFIELEYSLINQTNKLAIDSAYQKGIGVIVRGGLGTGMLTAYVKSHLKEPNLLYGPQVRALLNLTHGDYKKLTALALAFLYQDKHISTIIIGADRPEFIVADNQLLHSFKDPELLVQAQQILKQFTPPDLYTESQGTYYFNKH